MKFLLTFLLLLSSQTSFSQIRYSVDTFKYKEKEILLRRSSTSQLDSFQKLSRIAFRLSLYVQKLQKELDEAKSAIDEDRTIYDYTLSHAQELIDEAKNFYPAFDRELVLYQEELDFYTEYKKALPE